MCLDPTYRYSECFRCGVIGRSTCLSVLGDICIFDKWYNPISHFSLICQHIVNEEPKVQAFDEWARHWWIRCCDSDLANPHKIPWSSQRQRRSRWPVCNAKIAKNAAQECTCPTPIHLLGRLSLDFENDVLRSGGYRLMRSSSILAELLWGQRLSRNLSHSRLVNIENVLLELI